VGWAIGGLAGALLLALALPRLLVARAQDRLARRLLDSGAPFKLLTRAERVVGAHRRLPGLLGLTEEAVVFHGLFGENETIATSRIAKIMTGSRLGSGRKLLRSEALRLVSNGGDEVELVLSRASAGAWRSHLGLWAVGERRAAAETVTPGRR
jgi:hypothetical protein